MGLLRRRGLGAKGRAPWNCGTELRRARGCTRKRRSMAGLGEGCARGKARHAEARAVLGASRTEQPGAMAAARRGDGRRLGRRAGARLGLTRHPAAALLRLHLHLLRVGSPYRSRLIRPHLHNFIHILGC
ncbi:hypothetical protein ZWY2020_010513 [Hordeum vulgare]|nr:hypothetical protein ZWY2020_010513 [Hordeum vulgare]